MQGGQLVGGRYRIERLLGEGGMGSVYAARHEVTRKRFALKTMHRRNEELRLRFLREARAACAVEHPNVVEVYDVFEAEDGSPVMVMELLEGETLRERLARDPVLAESEAIGVLAQVVSAIAAAHAVDLIHRDLKPENVFLTAGGEVKVLDFGVAKLLAECGDAALTDSGAVVGTLLYMSPEQAFGRPAEPSTDVWALGAMLYECISGRRPILGDSTGEIIRNLSEPKIPPLGSLAQGTSPGVEAICTRMLTANPKERANIQEVAAALGVSLKAASSPQRAAGRDRAARAVSEVDPLGATATPDASGREGSGGNAAPRALDTADGHAAGEGDADAAVSAAAGFRSPRARRSVWMLVGIGVAAIGVVAYATSAKRVAAPSEEPHAAATVAASAPAATGSAEVPATAEALPLPIPVPHQPTAASSASAAVTATASGARSGGARAASSSAPRVPSSAASTTPPVEPPAATVSKPAPTGPSGISDKLPF